MRRCKSVQLDVTGKPRRTKVRLPTCILGSKTYSVPNQHVNTNTHAKNLEYLTYLSKALTKILKDIKGVVQIFWSKTLWLYYEQLLIKTEKGLFFHPYVLLSVPPAPVPDGGGAGEDEVSNSFPDWSQISGEGLPASPVVCWLWYDEGGHLFHHHCDHEERGCRHVQVQHQAVSVKKYPCIYLSVLFKSFWPIFKQMLGKILYFFLVNDFSTLSVKRENSIKTGALFITCDPSHRTED